MLRNAWCQTLTAYLLTALREDLGSRDCVTLDGYARMKACGVKAVVLWLKVIIVENVQNCFLCLLDYETWLIWCSRHDTTGLQDAKDTCVRMRIYKSWWICCYGDVSCLDGQSWMPRNACSRRCGCRNKSTRVGEHTISPRHRTHTQPDRRRSTSCSISICRSHGSRHRELHCIHWVYDLRTRTLNYIYRTWR